MKNLILIPLMFLLFACAHNQESGERQIKNHEWGTVIDARPVVVQDGSHTHSRGGSVGIGIRLAPGIRIGGNLGGSRSHSHPEYHDASQLTVRLDSGRVVKIVRRDKGNAIFNVGDRVRVYKHGHSLRVAH